MLASHAGNRVPITSAADAPCVRHRVFFCRHGVFYDSQEAWKLDARSNEDIGLAVEIDPDGKAATLESESLTGYGVSKPLRIGAQVK